MNILENHSLPVSELCSWSGICEIKTLRRATAFSLKNAVVAVVQSGYLFDCGDFSFYRVDAKEADTSSVDILADPTSQLDHSGWS